MKWKVVVISMMGTFLMGVDGHLPCGENSIVRTNFNSGYPPGQENQYQVFILLPATLERRHAYRRFDIECDGEATVEMIGRMGKATKINDTFSAIEIRPIDYRRVLRTHISFSVKGPDDGNVSYIKSVKLDGQELCEKPTMGYLDKHVEYLRSCGRRQINFNELITHGVATKPGDWPWHAAVYHRNGTTRTYQCGGTLIKKNVVLTAAHCVTLHKTPRKPEAVSVSLGKYNIFEDDTTSQNREVAAVIVHEEFRSPKPPDNDIALLVLSTEVIYNDYVQRACVCYDTVLPNEKVIGSVAGWGFDENGSVSPQLNAAALPLRSRDECILKDPPFYYIMLKNERKFCAGWGNGTSPCNGDSGGGFMVFVPDKQSSSSLSTPGRWYLKGVVADAPRLANTSKITCDPSYYVVYTDIAVYASWIRHYTTLVDIEMN